MASHTYKPKLAKLKSKLHALSEFLSTRITGTDEDLCNLLELCVNRQLSWPVPRNWSAGDWEAEVFQTVLMACCEAAWDFDPDRGVVFLNFLHSRIMSRALSHYRREWTHGQRFFPEIPEQSAEDEGQVLDDNPRCVAVIEAVAALPQAERRLMQQLFWDERTETQVGETLGLTRRAVNKRKQAALQLLRKNLQNRCHPPT